MQLSYAEIWRGIENLAEKKGLSLSALAVRAGLDPTSFNKSKRLSPDGRKRWPSTESMNKLLEATNTTIFEFMELAGEEAPKTHIIPLVGLNEAGQEGYFDAEGYPADTETWDGMEFPIAINNKVYTLEVSGDSMKPAYRDGDKLIVAPDAEIRRGDRVVVKLRTGEVLVRELGRKTASRIELKSLNSAYDDLHLQADDVLWMTRILWASQ